jgi:hypothetical protein
MTSLPAPTALRSFFTVDEGIAHRTVGIGNAAARHYRNFLDRLGNGAQLDGKRRNLAAHDPDARFDDRNKSVAFGADVVQPCREAFELDDAVVIGGCRSRQRRCDRLP